MMSDSSRRRRAWKGRRLRRIRRTAPFRHDHHRDLRFALRLRGRRRGGRGLHRNLRLKKLCHGSKRLVQLPRELRRARGELRQRGSLRRFERLHRALQDPHPFPPRRCGGRGRRHGRGRKERARGRGIVFAARVGRLEVEIFHPRREPDRHRRRATSVGPIEARTLLRRRLVIRRLNVRRVGRRARRKLRRRAGTGRRHRARLRRAHRHARGCRDARRRGLDMHVMRKVHGRCGTNRHEVPLDIVQKIHVEGTLAQAPRAFKMEPHHLEKTPLTTSR